jgi:murein DD-endopeptidase MepM/ murein hydrolase activator NlpD
MSPALIGLIVIALGSLGVVGAAVAAVMTGKPWSFGKVIPTGGVVSEGWGADRSAYGHIHEGIDLPAPVGTRVAAVEAGIVDYTGEDDQGGNIMRVAHEGGIYSFYMHLSKYVAWRGKHVKKGETIAKSGGEPGAPGAGVSSGAHVHVGVRVNDVGLNTYKEQFGTPTTGWGRVVGGLTSVPAEPLVPTGGYRLSVITYAQANKIPLKSGAFLAA